MPGLVRWTARHPQWSAGAEPGSSSDWDPIVGSVLYEPSSAAVVLIDPLLPASARDPLLPASARDPLLPANAREAFLEWLDARVAGRPVSILTTVHWHRRDRERLAERYRANTTRAWDDVPAGVQPRPLHGAEETLMWLPAVAALVAGDRLIGDGAGGVRVCPQSWLTEARANRADIAALMRPLLELPIERILVSHGEPVLSAGHAALERAVAEAERG